MTRGQRRAVRRGWWSEPPAWAWVLIVVGAVLVAVMAPLAVGRGELSPAEHAALQSQAAERRAATEASRAAAEAAEPPTVAFLGDSYTGGSDMDSGPDARWPAIVSAHFGWTPQIFAVGGTGYIDPGPENNAPFSERVQQVLLAGPDIVIVAGGINDADKYAPEVIAEEARAVVEQIRRGLPESRIVVVGPFLRRAPAPPETIATRDAIFTAVADLADVQVVDPLPWFEGGAVEIGADGTHPTDAGHAVIAARMIEALSGLGYPAR